MTSTLSSSLVYPSVVTSCLKGQVRHYVVASVSYAEKGLGKWKQHGNNKVRKHQKMTTHKSHKHYFTFTNIIISFSGNAIQCVRKGSAMLLKNVQKEKKKKKRKVTFLLKALIFKSKDKIMSKFVLLLACLTVIYLRKSR